jgi:hypothetical protein
MRRRAILTAALLCLLGLTATASAARPQVFQFSFDDPALEAEEVAFVSDICGFPVEVDLEGKVVVHIFDGGRTVEVDNYNLRGLYTNPANGETWRLVDAGPDRVYVRDGELFVGITGRSLTGSGVIGLVVIDLATGEAVLIAGNDRGFYVDNLCAALA